MKFLSDLWLSLFPFLNFMSFYWLIGSTISCFSSNLPFKILEGWSDFVAFHLFLIKLVLKFKRHSIISVLCLLELNSGLMDLSQNIEIFVLVHRGLPCLIKKDVIFLPEIIVKFTLILWFSLGTFCWCQ